MGPATPPTQPFELDEITIAQLQDGMRSGKWSSSSITRKYLERVAAIDRPSGRPDLAALRRGEGQYLNSIIELNPDAMAIAEECDRERKEGNIRGPLHGIPILIKDNIESADRMRTTAGSLALEENVAARDAFITSQLRKAGAVILGKTNLSEWANFRSTHSTSGWSGRGGQTKNPYALERNPCGSSSGSGAAVAANLVAVAVGTETDGSVVCPSSSNGLVGIKPTLGLISRSGIIPIAHSQDTAGPMARTVTDAVILLGVLAGVDTTDTATAASRKHASPDYTKYLDPRGMKGARIGVARQYFGFQREVDELMEEAIRTMKRMGATVVDPANIETNGKFDDTEGTVLHYEFKTDLNKYLAGTPAAVRSRTLEALIQFNEEHKAEEMPFFGQETFHKAQESGSLASSKYKEALAKNHKLSRAEGIDATLAKHKLDAIIAPTGGPAWPTDLVNGDHFTGGYSSASAVAGYPHITVPLGFAFGLPVGISFFAGAWSEPVLIKLAYAFEQETNARKPPTFAARAILL
ncbi:MAG: amidase [Acidobacteriota bacterium]